MLLSMITFYSCVNRNEDESNSQTIGEEELIRINRQLLDDDRSRILEYAKRRNWDLEQTQTGLYYQIIEEGEGPVPKTGDKVSFSYKMETLDGKPIYSSDKHGLKSFVVNESAIEAGWNEMSQIMKVGDSVRMILLPHLAFGLMGDGQGVPARQSILYELRLLKIE